ncbi:aspartyl protease family protein [uncultured Dokdonia sp.]|uniref:aspartyl protease family protein n=1 Tax=uncultured Dokdonia sp. TaxID=575653 RepID=UPI00344F8124
MPVKVAGEEKALTFVFDTGASTAVMDKAVVTRLRITTEDEVHSITGSRIQP